MVNSNQTKTRTVLAVGMLLLGLGIGCSEENSSSISVDLYGWIDEGDEAGHFIEDLREFAGSEEIHISVTRPGENAVLEHEVFAIEDRSARLPELDGGEGLRMDFEIHGAQGPIAAGATPVFDFEDRDGEHRGFRAMLAGIDDFAPVGALFRGSDEDRFDQTSFDSRQLPVDWSGRVGHTAHPTDSGQVLVVGGGQLSAAYEPAHVPQLSEVLNDIQLFDPSTGYFTELSGDQAAIDAEVAGQDRLATARAFHTVTPMGDDRFLVIGGFSLTEGVVRPQTSMELIDLNAAPGERVQPFTVDGVSVSLQDARGMHTATRRDSDGLVIVAGGLGPESDDIIATAEVIDPNGGVATVNMESSRVGHAAVLLDDDETVWLIGGRHQDGALAATEQIRVSQGALVTEEGPVLEQPRYGAAALFLGSDYNNQVVIVGGFTDDGATASYEVGNPRVRPDEIYARSAFQLDEARAEAELVRFHHSNDLLLVGGFDSDRQIKRSAQRLTVDLNSLEDLLAPVATPVGSMHQTRGAFAMSAVNNGRFIFVGGLDSDGVTRSDAEYFTPFDPVGSL